MLSPLLKQLNKKGLCVTLRGDAGLTVKPMNLLSEADKEAITKHKSELVSALRAMPEDPALPILTQYGWSVRYITDAIEARASVNELLDQGETLFGLDIETHGPSVLQGKVLFQGGLDPHLGNIRSIQIASDQKIVMVFDMTTVDPGILRPLLTGPGHFIAHNAGFEYRFLKKAGLLPRRLHCSMLMARLVFGLSAHGDRYPSLSDAAERMLDITISKDVRNSDWGIDGPLSTAQVNYAALDAALALLLAGPLEQELKDTAQLRVYWLIIRALPATQDVMLSGINFNRGLHASLTKQWERQTELSKKQIAEVIPEIRNPNSASQLAHWLEKTLPEEFGARWPRTEKGNLQTGADALSEWPECREALMLYKEFSKLSTTYGSAFADHIHPATGRIHSGFLLVGTKGGRFSCAHPNIQNPPRRSEFRELFIPSQGFVFVVADFSQIELRVCAIIADDRTMQEAYREGLDLHKLTAATAANTSLERVTIEQRQAAKAINFGLIYGMSAQTLVNYSWSSYRVRITLEQAKSFRRAFFELYRGILRWHQDVKRRGDLDKSVRTQTGLLRDMSSETGGWKFTNACNTPVQGSAAEVLLASLARLPDALEGLHARIVNHVHDEILVECLPEEVDRVKEILVTCMTDGFLEIFPQHPELTRGLVEAQSGENWYSAKRAG